MKPSRFEYRAPARKPGVEGATATFLAPFAAHAAGHDACTGFCRGVRTGASLKSRVRSMALWSVLCQLSWSRVCIAPARYGCMRRAHGEAKRPQGHHVSYSVFSV